MTQSKKTTALANPKTTGKFMGTYPQKQPEMYMQRLKIPGGRVDWYQWRSIAKLANLYTPDTPLHITTRQGIELHNVKADDSQKLKDDLAKIGLETLAAGGDSVRNITVCTGCDFDSGAVNVFPLAQQLKTHLQSQPFIYSMPRKFKISLSGCHNACARPFVSDLGFIAKPDGLFTVIGAGSLGAKPLLGIELYKNLNADDVIPLCTAAIEFFIEFGEYENRRKARFRHIRTRLGKKVFFEELNKRFEQKKSCQKWPKIPLQKTTATAKFTTKLNLVNGNISTKDALLLADIAEPADTNLRINITHSLDLYSQKPLQLPPELAKLENLPNIISCPAATTCPNAIIECHETYEKIAQSIQGSPNKNICIALSGCPNNCAHSATADIGLIGTIRKINGQQVRCFQSFVGGGNGKNDILSQKNEVVTKPDICNFIKKLVREKSE